MATLQIVPPALFDGREYSFLILKYLQKFLEISYLIKTHLKISNVLDKQTVFLSKQNGLSDLKLDKT
jgi:hypothetical protein